LIIERELLQAQLEEHRGFVRAMLSVVEVGYQQRFHDPSRMYQRCADSVAERVIQLLTNSTMHAEEWALVALSPAHAALVFPGCTLAVHYRVLSATSESPYRRLLVRMDYRLPGVRSKDVVDMFWRVWTVKEIEQMCMRALQVSQQEEALMANTRVVVHEEKDGGGLRRLASLYKTIEGVDRLVVANQRTTEVRRDVLERTHASSSSSSLSEHTNCHLSMRFASGLDLNGASSSTSDIEKPVPMVDGYINCSVCWDDTDQASCSSTIFSLREDFLYPTQTFDEFVKVNEGVVGERILRFASGFSLMLKDDRMRAKVTGARM
jgi:hypothetical protein